MDQIQKCPFCHKDALFSRELCPNCGYASKWEERGEPDLHLDANCKVPAYTEVLEEHMSQPQKRGRLLLALSCGMLVLPLLAWNAVNLCLCMSMDSIGRLHILSPLLLLCGTSWLSWKAWGGRTWARVSIGALAAIAGAAMSAYAARPPYGREKIASIAFLASAVFSIVALYSAYVILLSKDIMDFMHLQARHCKK